MRLTPRTSHRVIKGSHSSMRLCCLRRNRLGLEETRLRRLYTESNEGGLDLPSQPIGEHLLACLAYDWPESVQSINADNLRDWGVTVYEALEAALENLDSSTKGLPRSATTCIRSWRGIRMTPHG